MNEKETILCPSYRCEDGAILLGIVQADGHVAYAAERLVVDQHFVEQASLGRTPEKRFRFSGGCVEQNCKQWTGDRCGVIDNVLIDLGANFAAADLPQCSIRSDCRWFKQSGAAACRVCPEVITELSFAPCGDAQDGQK
jgi:hypothetical protein